MRIEKFVTLNNGVRVPSVGFGTYKALDGKDEQVILDALAAGYRHLDTASFYDTEAGIGEAVRKSGIRREELFLTSKLWKTEMGYKAAKEAFERTCEKLQTDYLDLYLIHWPRPDLQLQTWRELDIETWQALEELYAAGKVKAIGVSNFLKAHLENLLAHCSVKPAVDQIEFHPGYMQKEAVEYCRSQDIQVEAWSPMGRMRVFEHPLLQELSAAYEKSPAQICLRYSLQHGILPLPKATAPERMAQNLAVYDFEISDADMARLDALPDKTGWSGEHPDCEREPANIC